MSVYGRRYTLCNFREYRASYPRRHSPRVAPSNLADIEYRFRRGERLRHADWKRVAECAQLACEGDRFPRAMLLPAFISLFEIRDGEPNDDYLDFYLDNLPQQVRGAANQMLRASTKADQIRECCSLTLEVLAKHPAAPFWPMLPGRNIAAMLNFEHVTSGAALNAALRPHWPELWRAATGDTDSLERPQ